MTPSVVLDTREAYLVKRRSFPDSDVSRFTNDEKGLFEHPVDHLGIIASILSVGSQTS